MKYAATLLLSCTALAFAASSCSKDSDPAPTPKPTGPREYVVEYRVSSTQPGTQLEYLAYTNQTGGTTTLTSLTPLPATYTFKRTLKVADGLTLAATVADGKTDSDVTLQILLDGKEVKKTFTKGTNAGGVAVYVIGE